MVETFEIIEKRQVTFEDFQKARLEIRPSAMKEVWLMPVIFF
jgi:hypothetical protein